MAEKEHTDFCRSKFPPNCEPECKKHGQKCVRDSTYKGPLNRVISVVQPAAAAAAAAVNVAGPANHSNLIDIITRSSILDIIHNGKIREDYNIYLNTVDRSELNNKIQLYQLVTSDNFVRTVYSLGKGLDEVRYKKSVLSHREFLGFHAFEELYFMVKEKITSIRKPHNTNYKFLTARNVQITEDIQSLGINNLESIFRLFTDITYHRKFSSSPSLVFNAKLKPGAGNNSVKARNTLQPGQLFFFKLFPVATQMIEVENKSGKKTQKEIEYDTKGLQTEIKMYSELLKLVKYNITPNILCKIATAENVSGLKQFLDDTGMMAQANDFTFNKDINEDTLKVPVGTVWETVSLISTHKGGETVRNVFPDLNVEERRQVMFQILYNMYVFDKLEISQGDLHSENILINILPEEIELCYIVEGIQYCLKTKHLVKYFDLDRGMIGKETTLHFDGNQTAVMNKIDNPVREPTHWVNKEYGVTSIYNKNFELINLVTHETHGLLSNSNQRIRFQLVYPGKTVDEEFNTFIRDIIPGGVSAEKIHDTYTRLLSDPAEKEEADRIFDVKALNLKKDETDANWIQRSIKKYDIDEEIENMEWRKYFDLIKSEPNLGHIVKSTGIVKNNHLWIPDSIILPKLNMLRNGYFRKYINNTDFDITEKIVYTLDGMI
jgi:hypothetical protein